MANILHERNLLPTACELCPRACRANRRAGQTGLCGADDSLRVARAALHFWEEPPISGNAGSGTIFFSHCTLRCSYCQNAEIAAGEAGRAVSVEQLSRMMLRLQGQGALNINLVTPTHYVPQIHAALDTARDQGLTLPLIWNTSGYETVSAIRGNHGYADVYLTDFKYARAESARAYSHAADYLEVALAALDAMLEEVGQPVFDVFDGQERLRRGVVMRHLLLPGGLDESKEVLRLLWQRYGTGMLYSIMNQYTPWVCTRAEGGSESAQAFLEQYPAFASIVSGKDYEELLDYADELGIPEYFWQDGPAAEESFIPAFDLTGVID